MESSVIVLDEHHMWKDRTWLVGSSPELPSKLGMSEGSLVDIVGQLASCCMVSFINYLKPGRLNLAIKGSRGASGTVPMAISLNGITRVGPEPLASGFPHLHWHQT